MIAGPAFGAGAPALAGVPATAGATAALPPMAATGGGVLGVLGVLGGGDAGVPAAIELGSFGPSTGAAASEPHASEPNAIASVSMSNVGS